MSKSRKNVVDPDDIIASYGADTARWFMLSDSPPERDVIWTEAGVEGAHRFVQRVWRLVSEAAPAIAGVAAASSFEGEAGAVSKVAHKTLKAVGEDIGKLGFNKAVARIYELVNKISAFAGTAVAANGDGAVLAPAYAAALRQAVEFLLLDDRADDASSGGGMLGRAGRRGPDRRAPWPAFDPSLVMDNEIVLPVQMNGKKRGDLTIARDADQAAVEKATLELDFVQKALEGKPPRKVIVVPQRIVNVVI